VERWQPARGHQVGRRGGRNLAALSLGAAAACCPAPLSLTERTSDDTCGGAPRGPLPSRARGAKAEYHPLSTLGLVLKPIATCGKVYSHS
jgi:hypothetical protein